MISAFNDAHKDKGVQIRMELVPEEQYVTKVLAASATGKAPDFGWGTAGKAAGMARDEVTVPLDDLAKQVGLDLADFSESSLTASRYPKYDNKLFMIPMDLMSLQPEINLDIAKEAGLDPDKPPTDGEDAARMGEGDDQARGRQGHPLGHHDDRRRRAADGDLGHHRRADGLPARQRRSKTACVNPEAGKQAMQWVLDLFDKHKVSTRDVTDRYKAFGTGQGGIFWTGPWTLERLYRPEAEFQTSLFPKIGGTLRTYSEMGGLELYTQRRHRSLRGHAWRPSNGCRTTASCGRPWAAVPRRASRFGSSGLQDVRGSLGSSAAPSSRAWRSPRRRDPRGRRTGLHDLFRWQLPGQDA